VSQRGPIQRFDVDLPSGTTVVLVSSDPGTVLTDVRALFPTNGARTSICSNRRQRQDPARRPGVED
jgi:hypothetical protein